MLTKTDLFNACEKGDVEKVNECLNAKIYPNALNDKGWAPLHICINSATENVPEKNIIEIVTMLLKKGANPNSKLTKSGRTPFHLAAIYDLSQVIHALSKAEKIDIEAKQDHNDQTPLLTAADFGNFKSMLALLERGANIYAQEKDTNFSILEVMAKRLSDYEKFPGEEDKKIIESIHQILKELNVDKNLLSKNKDVLLKKTEIDKLLNERIMYTPSSDLPGWGDKGEDCILRKNQNNSLQRINEKINEFELKNENISINNPDNKINKDAQKWILERKEILENISAKLISFNNLENKIENNLFTTNNDLSINKDEQKKEKEIIKEKIEEQKKKEEKQENENENKNIFQKK